MGTINRLYEQNEPELQELIAHRRMFHQWPELGFSEFWTTASICEILEALGYELFCGEILYDQDSKKAVLTDPTRIQAYLLAQGRGAKDKWLAKMEGGFTGVIAHLKGAESGPIIGYRFDIDALPIEESHSDKHFPYMNGFASKNSCMHACGHDGHIAMGLGLAKRFAENMDKLSGDLYLIFQPAEEVNISGTSGGRVFSKLDLINRLDYLMPVHLGGINKRSIISGCSFLSSRKFEVSFIGRSSHAAASPEEGRNALLAACTAANSLYSIPRHREGLSRVNVGGFVSNNPTNVISSEANFLLELRGQTEIISNYLTDYATNIIKGSALMHGVEAEIRDAGETVTARNSKKMIDLVTSASLQVGIDRSAIIDEWLTSVSDDACFLMNSVQQAGGMATFVGIGSPTYGGHHNPEFDFDEDMLLWGVRILWEFAQMVAEVGKP